MKGHNSMKETLQGPLNSCLERYIGLGGGRVRDRGSEGRVS